MTSLNTYKGMPVPSWFNPRSAEAFHHMDMEPSDVIFSSGVKFGTTWMSKILHLLLHDNHNKGLSTYPDALPLDQDDNHKGFTKGRSEEENKTTFQTLLKQEHPRIFTTHLRGKDQLPKQLLGNCDEEGKGKLIVVLRNLKDVMASLHFFNGEAKDGWLGNEYGPGSFNRFIDEKCPNAFGSCFDWIRETDDIVQMLRNKPFVKMVAKKQKLDSKESRVLVLYYEQLKSDLPSELERINDFLDLPPLTAAKKEAVLEKVSFSSMRSEAGKGQEVFYRKGEVGDWKNYLSEEEWKNLFDKTFEKKLSGVEIAQPLRKYQ
mmetsp:Transcript_32006/g.47766  ORF Transcript_32006/g.47766 Transcript_32006/m.47766 type:complete len:318 (-) Transcript_32006:1026-1979(-)